MGQSTDGQLCFGILFDEDVEFPWDSDKYEGDIDEWWLYEVLGFKRSFEMFTDEEQWIGGREWPKEDMDKYHKEEDDFETKSRNLPVELVNYCSGDVPMYILSLPETVTIARRGYPKEIQPASLKTTGNQAAALVDFCYRHGIKHPNPATWYLSSFFG